MPQRYDRGTFKPGHRTPEGYLYADALATRTGVFEYRRADGTVQRELRPHDEVFDAESLASLGRKPVTLQHPPEPVGPGNISQYGAGAVGERIVEAEGGFVQVSLAIHRQDAIAAIDGGLRELSCGYTCELDPTPGEWQGRRYDAVQRRIRYNHLAIVDTGRAGPEVRLRLDADDAIMIDSQPPKQDGVTHKKRGNPMATLTIDGVTHEVEDAALAQKVADKIKLLDQTSQRADAAEQKRDELQGKHDALQAEVEKLQKERDDSSDREAWFNARFQERNELLGLAQQLKVDQVDKLDNAALKRAIVQAYSPDLKLDGKSEGYLEGSLEIIKHSIAQREQHLDGLARAIVPPAIPQPGQGDWRKDIQAARKAQLESLDGSSRLIQ